MSKILSEILTVCRAASASQDCDLEISTVFGLMSGSDDTKTLSLDG